MTEETGTAPARTPKRPIWSGSVTIGLVNVPVKLYAMIFEKGFSFRFLHQKDGQPLRYDRVCIKEDKVVPWQETVRGYEVSKGEFIMFTEEELKSARPESDRRIRIDKFVEYLSVDPVYFSTSYILVPDKSPEAYSLLLSVMQETCKGGVGKITLRTKEYPVLLHAYNGALVLTELRYAGEVADPTRLEELGKLKEPNENELKVATKIINDLTGKFDISEYKDRYRQRIEELIRKKVKGEKIVFEKPVKEEAKELMVALQETLQQLEKK